MRFQRTGHTVSILLLLILLLSACADTAQIPATPTSPPSSAPSPAVAVVTPTEAVSPPEQPGQDLPSGDEIGLRIEYILTADWGAVDIEGLPETTDVTIVEVAGQSNHSAGPPGIYLARDYSRDDAVLVVDIIAPASDTPIIRF